MTLEDEVRAIINTLVWEAIVNAPYAEAKRRENEAIAALMLLMEEHQARNLEVALERNDILAEQVGELVGKNFALESALLGGPPTTGVPIEDQIEIVLYSARSIVERWGKSSDYVAHIKAALETLRWVQGNLKERALIEGESKGPRP